MFVSSFKKEAIIITTALYYLLVIYYGFNKSDIQSAVEAERFIH